MPAFREAVLLLAIPTGADRSRVRELRATMQRHLAAILSADVVGYMRLSEAAEEETHHRLMALRADLIDPCVGEHGGRVVKNTGDGFLATFGSLGVFPALAPINSRSLGSKQTTARRPLLVAYGRRIASSTSAGS